MKLPLQAENLQASPAGLLQSANHFSMGAQQQRCPSCFVLLAMQAEDLQAGLDRSAAACKALKHELDALRQHYGSPEVATARTEAHLASLTVAQRVAEQVRGNK